MPKDSHELNVKWQAILVIHEKFLLATSLGGIVSFSILDSAQSLNIV